MNTIQNIKTFMKWNIHSILENKKSSRQSFSKVIHKIAVKFKDHNFIG